MKTIFVVDDSDTNLSMAETALEEIYRVMTMPSAAKMFLFLEKVIPDLILLDIEMPEIDGFEALKRLKASPLWFEIPVIFLTGRTDSDVEARGFEMGVIDFITKPFSTPVLRNRLKTHLGIDKIIRERTAKLINMQHSIVAVLSDMVENRDKKTSGHIERTSEYIKIMIDEMKKKNIYTEEIENWDVEKITSSARMHDLGKITITDMIVNKPGTLTPEEYEEMKKHATEGERIIEEIIARTGEGDFLTYAKLFAGTHHERWDGQGYPRGLKGEEIPLQGRIMAIVDSYDALVTERSYKKAFTEEEAMDILREKAGINYDPRIVEVFYGARERIKAARAAIQ